MKTIKKVNPETILSNQEIALLIGGKKKYKIGDKEVTKEEYKETVLEATGSPSAN